MKEIWLILFLTLIQISLLAQGSKSRPIVNQAGYNLGEAKRFVCYGAAEGKAFRIIYAKDTSNQKAKALYEGTINDFVGNFTNFNPISKEEFIVQVEGHGNSYPFWIADHLMEKLSSQLAYQFFIDVRGSENPIYSNEGEVPGGGPSRDGGAYTLEALYEVLLYASNPSLFDRWHSDFGDQEMPDLIKLILWHGEFAFHHRDFKGPTTKRPYYVGHPDEKLYEYDYQNTLDQLAAVCAAWHLFLKPYLPETQYQRYRQACLDNWEAYERDRVVRYYVKSNKWVDFGWQEFNEMGNVFGQAIFRNLMMYLSEKKEKDGNPEKFLTYARMAAQDVINNWDFNNPRHMWWIRNGEHITPQALAFFLMIAPEEAPHGTKEKLAAWAQHMKVKTNNFWHYRKHSETEWAHPKTKELGNAGLGGSMFIVAHLLDDKELRSIAWSQVNQVFGMNPAEAHYSNKSQERLDLNGYWEGIEVGWPMSHPDGFGQLGLVRGTLDGTPLDNMFPYVPKVAIDNIDNYAYATEGWAVTNRAWMSSVIYATIGSHELKIFDETYKNEIKSSKAGETITIQLRAALNMDWEKRETGEVMVQIDGAEAFKIELTESDVNTGLFIGKLKLDDPSGSRVRVSYGHLGFEKVVVFQLQ
ncbi:MAG: hypothetical protein AAF849_11945 [Bacteroidota bacterium]